MKLKTAACGINCNECDLYKAEHDMKAAEALVDWFKGRGWIKPDEGAEAVMKMAPLCKGCWGECDVHWSGDCDLRLCCEQKELYSCGDCDDFPCENYKEWANEDNHHKKAMEYLLSLKSNNS